MSGQFLVFQRDFDMCNWRSWIWPGLITTALLTALTGWFLSGPVEEDLAMRAGKELKAAQPWSAIDFDGRDGALLGEAESDTQVADATKLALGTYGVRVLANNTTVAAKPVPAPEPVVEPAPAPAAVEPAPVVAAAPYIWAATSGTGGVKVEGSVPSADVAKLAIDLATRRFVKTEVTDAQTVLDGAPEGFADAQATVLKSLSYLSIGKATITDKTVSVEGEAPSEFAMKFVTDKLKAALPAGYELVTKVAVVVPVAMAAAVIKAPKPYVWSAISNADGVKLEGSVLSGAVGEAVLGVASASFAGKTITSAQTALNNSPAGFATAQREALKGLAQLQEGTATISDKTVTLTGVASTDDIKASVASSVKSALPEGYTLAADITVPAPVAPAAPYIWTAAAQASGVTLGGTVPTADVGSAALELAKRRFVKTEVTDTQAILDGAPEGFADGQIASLKALTYLTEGKAIQTDKAIDIVGIAPSEAIKALVIKNTTASVPAGYVLTTNITVVAPTPVVVEPAPVAVVVEAPAVKGDCAADITALLAAEQIGFVTNKSDINDTSTALLAKIATSLASCPDKQFEIGGHTDSDGSNAYNNRLSNDRALAVRTALRAAKIDPERLTSRGYGETAPAAANDTEVNKAKNRRIEFRAVE